LSSREPARTELGCTIRQAFAVAGRSDGRWGRGSNMKPQQIVVTGATGFVGRNLMPVLIEHYGQAQMVGLSSQDYDLSRPDEAKRMLRQHKPDVLVHLAAYVGGIGANKAYPADFYYRNMLLQANVF